MRRLAIFLALIFCCTKTAGAAPSSVWWPSWTISSSEELSNGIEYSKNSWTPTFPLSFLFDGNSKTAWVYSAKSNEFQAPFRSRYGIEMMPKTPVEIDGLRLMNGQNASRARFLKNKRVTKIRVWMQNRKTIWTRNFVLRDAMGFQNVKLPRRKISSLRIEFIGFKSGNSDNDLCVSELQLMNRGKTIDMKMPRAVMFYDGLEGCGASYLLCGGTMLDGIAIDAGYGDEWSSDAKYVAGLSGGGGKQYLWIADATRGEIMRKIYNENDLEYRWQKGNRLRVRQYVKEKFVPFKILSPPFK